MFKILMITYCLFYAASVLALDIVKDGKAVSEIVLAKDANQSQKLGAADLQEFFEKISGAKVEIVPTPSGKFKNKIYVGESDFTKKLGFDLKGVEKGGYKLVVADDYAIVAGRDRHYQTTPSMYGIKWTAEDLKRFQDRVGAPVMKNIGGRSRGKQVKTLGILSQDDTGSWYAASELLQQLGVRWYHPNETIVPVSKNIVLQKQNLTKAPVSAMRPLGCY